MSTLADLDELIVSCRSAAARGYMAEAVACYRAGAQRASIVATWTAVLFDFIDKLRELEMAGDANARQKLTEFENARQSNDWKQSLAFERRVIDLAQNEFQLVSPVEALDLGRLSEDRNRCAHPSMTSPNDPYRPTAELARTHIRNAVDHLLSHPPVQGKAALERILRDVESEYFPTRPEPAIEFFKMGPLARARDALVRNLIVVMTKTVLGKPSQAQSRERRFAALNAILAMHAHAGERTMLTSLPGLVESVPDETWYRVFFYLSHIPISWDYIGNAAQIKAEECVKNCAVDLLPKFLPSAVRIAKLRPFALQRVAQATNATLARILSVDLSADYVGEAIERAKNARSFRGAETILETLVLPLADLLTAKEIESVCQIFVSNSQVTYAGGVPDLMLRLFRSTDRHLRDTETGWRKVFDKLVEEKENITTGAGLRRELEAKYNFVYPF